MRRKLFVLLGLAAFAVLLYLLAGKDFDAGLFFQSLSSIRPGWTVAAVGLTFLCYVIRSLRWQVLLISFKRIGLSSLFPTTVLGFGAIYVLGRAGEFVRPVWIARREGIPISGSVATIAVERVFDALMLVLLAGVSMALVALPETAMGVVSELRSAMWVSLSGAALALMASIFLNRPIAKLARRIPFRRIGRPIESFALGLRSTSNGRILGVVLGYSVLLWFVLALQFWLMLIGLNLDLGFSGSMLVLVFACLGSVAQIPGIGGGLQAALVFALTGIFGIEAEIAFAASLLLWIISYAPTLIVGVVYMGSKGISTRQLWWREPAPLEGHASRLNSPATNL